MDSRQQAASSRVAFHANLLAYKIFSKSIKNHQNKFGGTNKSVRDACAAPWTGSERTLINEL